MVISNEGRLQPRRDAIKMLGLSGREPFTNASEEIIVFNFGEWERQSQKLKILSHYL